MKKQSKAKKLELMRSVVRDLSEAHGGAIAHPNTGCLVGTYTKDRAQDETCKFSSALRF